MQAVSIYLAIISYVSMLTTVFVGFRYFKNRFKKHNHVGMLALLTFALTTFHTVSILFFTFSH